MKKTMLRRVTALSAALMVVTGAAASCGKGKSEKNELKDPEKMMSGSYHAVEIETDAENVDGIYRISEGFLITGQDSEHNSPVFYVTDNEFNTVNTLTPDFKVDKDADVSFSTTVSNDGDIYVMATFVDYGDAEQPDYDDPEFDYEKFDWDKYYESMTQTYKIYSVDLNGDIKSENEITGLDEYIDPDDEDSRYMSLQRLNACGGGKLIACVSGMEEKYLVIDSDGKVVKEIDVSDIDYLRGISVIDDKTLAVNGYTQKGAKIVFIDSENFQPTGDELTDDSVSDIMYGSLFAGTGDYKLLSASSTGLFGLKEDGSSEEIINWLDSDLGEGDVQALIALDNGEYVMYYYDYMSVNGGGSLYRLTKRDASELADMKVLTIASLNGDWLIKSQVSAFNKAHDDVRFKVIDYSKYNEYDEEKTTLKSSAEDKLKSDIISGNAPDMIITNGGNMLQTLGSKGLLVDLYDYLDKDPELKRDDIMPNVLKAGEKKGKLLSLASSFYVSTLVAKKKYVDKEGWTVDELIDTYENRKNKDMHLIGDDKRGSVMALLVYSFYDLVDAEKGECNFDDPEFLKLLEFCDQFEPEKYDEDEMIYETSDSDYYSGAAFKNDKVLLTDFSIYDTSSIVETVNGTFGGEDVCYVGYPSSSGDGTIMTTFTEFSILKTSEDKDLCWEFIKENFKEETDEDEESGKYSYSFGLPALKKNFERELDKCMSKPYYINEDGKKEEYAYYF